MHLTAYRIPFKINDTRNELLYQIEKKYYMFWISVDGSLFKLLVPSLMIFLEMGELGTDLKVHESWLSQFQLYGW